MSSPPVLSSRLDNPQSVWAICPNCHSLPPVGDNLGITWVIVGKSVDNHGGDEMERVWFVMSGFTTQVYPHFLPGITHNLYNRNTRVEQGFCGLSTVKSSSYYDYLYIHTPSYTNNLSGKTYTNIDLKSRGQK